MVSTKHSPVVGVFSDRSQANHALGALRSAGWSEDQLGFITPKSGEITEELTIFQANPLFLTTFLREAITLSKTLST